MTGTAEGRLCLVFIVRTVNTVHILLGEVLEGNCTRSWKGRHTAWAGKAGVPWHKAASIRPPGFPCLNEVVLFSACRLEAVTKLRGEREGASYPIGACGADETEQGGS